MPNSLTNVTKATAFDVFRDFSCLFMIILNASHILIVNVPLVASHCVLFYTSLNASAYNFWSRGMCEQFLKKLKKITTLYESETPVQTFP